MEKPPRFDGPKRNYNLRAISSSGERLYLVPPMVELRPSRIEFLASSLDEKVEDIAENYKIYNDQNKINADRDITIVKLYSAMSLLSKLSYFVSDKNEFKYIEAQFGNDNLRLAFDSSAESYKFASEQALRIYSSLDFVDQLLADLFGDNPESGIEFIDMFDTPLWYNYAGKDFIDNSALLILQLLNEYERYYTNGFSEEHFQHRTFLEKAHIMLRRYMISILDSAQLPHRSKSAKATLPRLINNAWQVYQIEIGQSLSDNDDAS